MKFGLSEVKIAKFNEETGEYKEVEPLKGIKKEDFCMEFDATPETEKINQVIFGTHVNREDSEYNEISREIDEECEMLYSAFRSILYDLMKQYHKNVAHIELPHNLLIHVTRNALWQQIKDFHSIAHKNDSAVMRQLSKTSKIIMTSMMRGGFEKTVKKMFSITEIQFKCAMLAIMKKHNLTELHMDFYDGFVPCNLKRELLEQELSSDDTSPVNMIKQLMERKYHVK